MTHQSKDIFRKTISYHFELDRDYANKFRGTFIGELEKLSTLPDRWTPMKHNCRGRLVLWYYIIYTIDEEKKLVLIVDIIDPRQYTKAIDYL